MFRGTGQALTENVATFAAVTAMVTQHQNLLDSIALRNLNAVGLRRNHYPPAHEYSTLAKMSHDAPHGFDFVRKGMLSSGVEIECAFREIEHPEGRFRREDGTRYDLCVLEVLADPGLRPPAVCRAEFVGDGADNLPVVIRIGNVRQSSFRLRLISPGAAFGTTVAAGKSTAALA